MYILFERVIWLFDNKRWKIITYVFLYELFSQENYIYVYIRET